MDNSQWRRKLAEECSKAVIERFMLAEDPEISVRKALLRAILAARIANGIAEA
jgi:hypothetical protein